MPTAHLVAAQMEAWPSGAAHYRTDDGRDFAVIAQADLDEAAKAYINQVLESLGDNPIPPMVVPAAQHRIIPQPTVIVPINADGTTNDMTPLWSFQPGASHQDALRAAGFDIAEEE